MPKWIYKAVSQPKVNALILYKYLPCNEYTFRALAVRGLWCHNPREMNDPSECLYSIDRILSKPDISKLKELIKSDPSSVLAPISKLSDDKINKIFSDYRKKLANNFAFCSLSTKCDDVLMWSHYANSHKGIVLGIDIDTDDLQEHLQEIKYLNKLPEWDIAKYFDFMNGDDSHNGIFFQDLSVKSKHWIKESEYRIWRKMPGYWVYKESQIKELYFGVNCDHITKKVVLELLNFLPGNFPVNEMKIDKNTLDLEFCQ